MTIDSKSQKVKNQTMVINNRSQKFRQLKRMKQHDMAILKYISICKLANRQQILEGLHRYLEETDENKRAGLMQVFEDIGILSEKDVCFLQHLHDYFTTNELDKKFADLAVKNKLLKSKQIDVAFTKQLEIFKTSQKVKSISEILILSGYLKQEYCDALRYRLNIVTPEKEQTLFGNIAVNKGIINKQQLNDVLSIQESEFQNSQKIRLLGSILMEKQIISQKQCNVILNRQRQLKEKEAFEKKWNINVERLAPFFKYQQLKALLSAL